MKSRNNGYSPTSQSIFGSSLDLIAVNKINEIANAFSSARRDWLASLSDPRRDIDDECGYPKIISLDDYYDLYTREPYAARVVEMLPKETWQVVPDLYENDDDKPTQFENDWDELGASLGMGMGLFESKQANPIWEILQRVDILSGIGEYGVLVIGTNDPQRMDEPFEFKDGKKTEVLYIRAFPQIQAQVIATDTDPKSRRYGYPLRYLITINDPKTSFGIGSGMTNNTFVADWTRVIHVADNMQTSPIFGVPRMRPVFNALSDIKKVRGGSGEMYWKGAFNGLFFGTNPQLGGDVVIDEDKFRDDVENFMNGLQRYMAAPGMTANPLQPNISDPTPFIDAQIEAICVKFGFPKRKFLGSERGELASTQDEDDWNGRIRNRQNTYVSPSLAVPFVDRLIAMGALTKPEQYYLDWPDLESQSKSEKAAIAVQLVQAMAQYISSGADALMPPIMFLSRVMPFDDREAEAIVKAAMKHLDDKDSNRINPVVRKATQVNQPKPQPAKQVPAGQPSPGQEQQAGIGQARQGNTNG